MISVVILFTMHISNIIGYILILFIINGNIIYKMFYFMNAIMIEIQNI